MRERDTSHTRLQLKEKIHWKMYSKTANNGIEQEAINIPQRRASNPRMKNLTIARSIKPDV